MQREYTEITKAILNEDIAALEDMHSRSANFAYVGDSKPYIYTAIERHNPELVSKLIEFGVNLSVTYTETVRPTYSHTEYADSKEGLFSPLVYALLFETEVEAESFKNGVFSIVLNATTDIDTMVGGLTALMWAAHYNKDLAIKSLISKGANLEATDEIHGDTAILIAANKGCPQAFIALEKAKAKVDAVDNLGNNALSKAIDHEPTSYTESNVEMIKYLTENHSHLLVTKNNTGLTALEVFVGKIEKYTHYLPSTGIDIDAANSTHFAKAMEIIKVSARLQEMAAIKQKVLNLDAQRVTPAATAAASPRGGAGTDAASSADSTKGSGPSSCGIM